jgi:TolB-like protein/DNA-binding winged helix-turn-helix (wHTH) protein/Tfp pilus assembly protein PilF
VSGSCDIIEFGPFRLDLQRRLLSRAGEPVAVSSRAFDILAMLVAHRDRVLTKDEIMTQVWRGTIVEENNLAVQISALRRALADPADATPVIATIPGQGYRFVGKLAAQPAPAEAATAPPPPPPPAPAGSFRLPRLLPAIPFWLKAAVAAAAIASLAIKLFLLLHVTATPIAAPKTAPPPPPPPPAQAPRLSLAVLPFRDLSDDRCCDYLADAISDDLTTDLSHIPGSTVIARESSDAFRGRAMPTADIGRALNVRYLLEGSLRAVEGRFSINAQLIEAATGIHLWAERFEIPRDHLAAAQEQIVQRLASALGVTLVDIEGSASLREHAQSPDALDLFLRARSILDRSDTLAAMTDAQHLLEQAVGKQPGFIEAQAELAWLLPRKANNFAYPTQAADIAEARATIAEALRPGVNTAAPGMALALAAKGALQGNDGHCEDAASSYRAALAIAPDSVQAQTGQIACLTALARFDAVTAGLKTLMRIDPESPRNKVRAQQLGFAFLMLGQPAQAIPWLQQSTAGDAEPAPGADDLGRVEWSRLLLIAAEAMTGDTASAQRLYAEHQRVWPYRTVWHLASELTRAQATLPTFAAVQAAWRQMGMPQFADEHADFGVTADPKMREHKRLEPTPLALPGVAGIDAAGLGAALQRPDPPAVIDFGFGAAVPPSAQLSAADPLSANDMAALARQLGSFRGVVVMGQGPFDWSSVNAARALADEGIRVTWFRGGEEAWAKAGLPAADRRGR